MQSVSTDNFGPLVAYLVPGAVVLSALSFYSVTLRTWFSVGASDAPTVGGFLFLTVASLAIGMTVSAIRWAAIDRLLRLTGLPKPPLDFARLTANLAAIRYLTEVHYTHYLFYANMAVASAAAYTLLAVKLGVFSSAGWLAVSFVILEVVFLAAARDALAQHRLRSAQVLGQTRAAKADAITSDV
jgi:hypothetical protein